MKDPASHAAATILSVMARGSAKDGREEGWRDKPQDYHLDRAIRHLMTYRLIRDGNQAPDGERHLDLAVTRLSFALSQDKT